LALYVSLVIVVKIQGVIENKDQEKIESNEIEGKKSFKTAI